jgi:hypothetical protein
MGLEGIGHQGVIAVYQLWAWFEDLTGGHPYIVLGSLVVVVMGWMLVKMEVSVK